MINVALALLVVGGACFLARVVMGPSIADRIVALDGLVVTIVAAILLGSVRNGTPEFVDTAVVVAFIGFVGTSAAARFIERRGG
ncbi:MAG TPA: monovalent cation/H+ antiporter complex subunit F [Microthrixaceae bacterium]|nr:monovalent cation/H+ antiporter complex subunit F [Microthrixaceae bacterium]